MGRIIITVISMPSGEGCGINRLLPVPGKQCGKSFTIFFHPLDRLADGSIYFVTASDTFKRLLILHPDQLFKVILHG